MKIGPVKAELFPADRPTDMTKITDVFSEFANAPKKQKSEFRSFAPISVFCTMN